MEDGILMKKGLNTLKGLYTHLLKVLYTHLLKGLRYIHLLKGLNT